MSRSPCRTQGETAKTSGLMNCSFSKFSAIRTPILLIIGTDYEVFATPRGDIRNQPLL
jgi:hypothetical protein